MARKPRSTTTPALPQGAAEAIRAKIASGKTQGALKAAKLLAKETPGPESEALLVAAYRARFDTLSRAGMADEASDILAVARSRFPQLGDDWGDLQRDHARRTGDLSDLLEEWAAPDTTTERRAELGREIERHTLDPAHLAAAPELAADDPLRLAARAAQRAFAEATAGTLSSAARADLTVIARRSPLAPWRHLALAVADFPEFEDETALRHVARIPEHAAVHRVAAQLRELIETGELAQPPSGAAGKLFDHITGASGRLRALARRFDDAHRGDRGRLASAAAVELTAALVSAHGQLALRFARWLVAADVHLEREAVSSLDGLLRDEWRRLLALESGPDDALGVAMGWTDWLQPKPNGPLRRLTDLELALALTQLASVADGACADASLTLRMHGFDVAAADLVSTKHARALIERLDEGTPDSVTECAILALGLSQLLHKLRTASSAHGPDPVPSPPGVADTLLGHACALDPTPARFQALCRAFENTAGEDPKAMLERWVEAIPGDAEPLLRLVERAAARSAHRQAEAYLERAAELAPTDERVRAWRYRILSTRLHAHLRQQRYPLCEQDLQQLDALAGMTPERRTYLAAARCRLAGLSGGDEAAARVALDARTRAPAVSRALLELVDAAVADRPGRVTVPGDDLTNRLHNLVDILRVITSAAPAAVSAVAFEAAAPPDRVPGIPEDPHALTLLCQYFAATDNVDWLHLCSGIGLCTEGPPLARFALLRSQALWSSARDFARGLDVARLAIHLAQRFRDAGVLREVSAVLPVGLLDAGQDLEPAEAERILKRERRHQGPLSRTTHRRASTGGGEDGTAAPRRRRRSRQQPILPFDLTDTATGEQPSTDA